MSKFWAFVADNIVSLVTVVVGLGILIVQTTNQNPNLLLISSATLGLVTLLATSEIIERQRRLSRMEKLLEEAVKQVQLGARQNTEQLQNGTKEVIDILKLGFDETMVQTKAPNDYYEYISYRFASAKQSIHWFGVDPRRSWKTDTRRPYEDAFEHVVKEGKVQIRWITSLGSKARKDRAYEIIFGRNNSPSAFVGYIPDSATIPVFAFVIIDNEELLIRPPLEEGGRVTYAVISSKAIVKVFLEYFDKVWEKAVKLDKSENTRHFLKEVPQSQLEKS
jgi:hypothetical protein